MHIKVRYVGMVRTMLGGTKEEEVELPEESTAYQLLVKIAEKNGETFRNHCIEKEWGRIRNNVKVMVDGEHIMLCPGRYEMKLDGKKEMVIASCCDVFSSS
ncbi:hypothetical protein ACFLU8_03760 [Chloroflexota bacterium]